MKIFLHNLKNSTKSIGFKTRNNKVGKSKYLPSFSKEWKNTIYSFDKNIISNLPMLTQTINKILKSYFGQYFVGTQNIRGENLKKFRKISRFLRKIFISDAEIKHTNEKMIITLYVLNREKNILKYKYFQAIETILKGKSDTIENSNWDSKKFQSPINFLISFYSGNIRWFYSYYSRLWSKKNMTLGLNDQISKYDYLKNKYETLNQFKIYNSMYIDKLWTKVFENFAMKFSQTFAEHSLFYTINQSKFNKTTFLSGLSYILKKIISKKIEYHIVNLKYLTNSPDIFTDVIALKLRKRKIRRLQEVSRVLNRTHIPITNTIQERTFIGKREDYYKNKYKDLKITSLLKKYYLYKKLRINGLNFNSISGAAYNLNYLLNKSSYFKRMFYNSKRYNLNSLLINPTSYESSCKIPGQALSKPRKSMINNIYESIKYKNIGGIRIEVKGRLTKRYRADRSVYSLRWKGGLKNIDSSFQRMNTVLWRGNTKSNTAYSISTDKRRIGAFAVKGWIAGK